MYEYKFIKLDIEYKAFKRVNAPESLYDIIHDHAKDGWRLVQIFAPPIKDYGIAKYFEIILEREV